MQPRKDYEDYSKFINDSFADDKEEMFRKSPRAIELNSPLRTFADRDTMNRTTGFFSTRNASISKTRNQTSLSSGKGFASFSHEFTVKPKVLESKLTTHKDFMGLSDGFKRAFAHDKKDEKMVLPITGYCGHRRGERSQNFFGKSFREQSMQSKKLQREF
jgi:hypothetical protein